MSSKKLNIDSPPKGRGFGGKQIKLGGYNIEDNLTDNTVKSKNLAPSEYTHHLGTVSSYSPMAVRKPKFESNSIERIQIDSGGGIVAKFNRFSP